jgi:hypothetical protein
MKFAEIIKKNISLVAFLVITSGMIIAQFYYAQFAHLTIYEWGAIALYSLWFLVIGIVDIKFMRVPFGLTVPVIIAGLLWRFIDGTEQQNVLIGFDSNPFMAACGISFGFIISDLITHFGNWFVKYPQSSQGLTALWVAIPIMLVNTFVPIYPLWAVSLAVIVLRGLVYLLSKQNKSFNQALEKLQKNPLAAYILFFIVIIGAGFYSIQNAHSQAERTFLIIFALCSSFILEETILPFISGFFHKEVVSEEEDQKSIMGGGDAMFNAALGSLWGPLVIANCLIMAFLEALLFTGCIRILQLIKKVPKDMSAEMPFTPFIILSAQIILLVDILSKVN